MAVTAKAWAAKAKACHGCQGMGCPCQGYAMAAKACHSQGMCYQGNAKAWVAYAKACAAKAMLSLSRHATVAKACATKAMPWLVTAKACAAKAMP